MSVHMMGLSGSIQVFDKSVWGGGLSDLNAYKASGGGGGGGGIEGSLEAKCIRS